MSAELSRVTDLVRTFRILQRLMDLYLPLEAEGRTMVPLTISRERAEDGYAWTFDLSTDRPDGEDIEICARHANLASAAWRAYFELYFALHPGEAKPRTQTARRRFRGWR